MKDVPAQKSSPPLPHKNNLSQQTKNQKPFKLTVVSLHNYYRNLQCTFISLMHVMAFSEQHDNDRFICSNGTKLEHLPILQFDLRFYHSWAKTIEKSLSTYLS